MPDRLRLFKRNSNVMARSVALYVELSRHDGKAFTMTVLLVLTIEVFL